MSFSMSKHLLNQFTNICSLCKSIELVTLLTLQMFKNKIVDSFQLLKLLYSYLKENVSLNYRESYHLLIPFLTDKSCSGIVNNYLWSNIKEMLLVLSYQNMIIQIYGTSTRFQKNIAMHSHNKYVLGNLYHLSNETITFYTSFLLFKEMVFLENHYFLFFFNEYVSIYNQVVNYYLLRSLSSFISLFLVNEYSFFLRDINILLHIYFFFLSVLLLDLIESNMYSELGSRANSMSNSIKSAKDNIKYYTLIYNRYRQAKITNEIIEIISSSNI